MQIDGKLALRLARRVRDEAGSAAVLLRAGLVQPGDPRQIVEGLLAVQRFGVVGGLPGLCAGRDPDRAAIIDERGALTFRELDEHSSALANAWRARGLRAGDGVAILARNHRGFIEALFAGCKAGARVILLNTDFAAPQVREVAAREGARLLVYDEEFAHAVVETDLPLGHWRAWTDAPEAQEGGDTLEALIAHGNTVAPPKPEKAAAIVILTSGTTGTPKGAVRQQPPSLTPLGALVGRVPFRSGGSTMIAAPLFHAFGLINTIAACALGCTIIVRRRFDAALVLEDIENHRPSGLVTVPVMLRRLLDSYDEQPRATGSLKVIFLSGSALGGTLATRALDTLGEVIYNLYGSTEVAFATIATPTDLRAAPDCVGTPTLGSVVKVLDDNGHPVHTGTTGRIFVGNAFPFEGYTGGGGKQIIGGLLSSGDVGHFDHNGRLFIDGRDDDMIISGGENVFPAEVEELLCGHEQIEEAAAVGVDDEKFGQRLRVYVVLNKGATLSADDVRAYVRDNLARYKVPRDVEFVERLPRNPTGKVLKRELA